MNEGVEAAFRLLEPRIRSTHVHDNDGETIRICSRWSADGGTIDWMRTMERCESLTDQYPLLLELREVPDMANPLDACASVSTVWRI